MSKLPKMSASVISKPFVLRHTTFGGAKLVIHAWVGFVPKRGVLGDFHKQIQQNKIESKKRWVKGT